MKTILSLITVILLSSTALYSQQQFSETQDEQIERISKSKFQEKIATGEYILFDVRTTEEYMEGHLEGAKSLDFLNENFVNTITSLNKNYKYLIYCQSGARSAKALQQMKEAGFIHVLELEGGYSNW
jgi:rhodanese-related sulfurtransferase